nr:hypothetical protein [Kofleriaceae bacterium]
MTDPRRWIYGSLDVVAALAYVAAVALAVPNRHVASAVHLYAIPVAAAVAAAGMFLGHARGRRVALAGATAWLALTFLLIVRICISAAFLAGVYGAFGKAAASFALLIVALLVEVVALLPIVQVKFLMSRAGRRAYA